MVLPHSSLRLWGAGIRCWLWCLAWVSIGLFAPQVAMAQGGIKQAFPQAAEFSQLFLRDRAPPKDILYCHVDLELFNEPFTNACQAARSHINLVAFRHGIVFLPVEDEEKFFAIVDILYKNAKPK